MCVYKCVTSYVCHLASREDATWHTHSVPSSGNIQRSTKKAFTAFSENPSQPYFAHQNPAPSQPLSPPPPSCTLGASFAGWYLLGCRRTRVRGAMRRGVRRLVVPTGALSTA